MRRVLLGSLLVSLAVGSSCLFTTNPPQHSDQPGETTNLNLTIVSGLVRHFDRSDHHYRNTPDRPVRILWLGPDRNNDGAAEILWDVIVRSGRDGTYECSYSRPDIRAVEVQAMRCDYDPNDPDPGADCCLESPPCNSPICSLWLQSRHLTANSGDRLQQDLVVPCDHVP